jgi:hypothetical protein
MIEVDCGFWVRPGGFHLDRIGWSSDTLATTRLRVGRKIRGGGESGLVMEDENYLDFQLGYAEWRREGPLVCGGGHTSRIAAARLGPGRRRLDVGRVGVSPRNHEGAVSPQRRRAGGVRPAGLQLQLVGSCGWALAVVRERAGM